MDLQRWTEEVVHTQEIVRHVDVLVYLIQEALLSNEVCSQVGWRPSSSSSLPPMPSGIIDGTQQQVVCEASSNSDCLRALYCSINSDCLLADSCFVGPKLR